MIELYATTRIMQIKKEINELLFIMLEQKYLKDTPQKNVTITN